MCTYNKHHQSKLIGVDDALQVILKVQSFFLFAHCMTNAKLSVPLEAKWRWRVCVCVCMCKNETVRKKLQLELQNQLKNSIGCDDLKLMMFQ